MTTTTTKRKATPPRRAAPARGNGNGNGVPIPPASAAELRAPERFEPTTTPQVPKAPEAPPPATPAPAPAPAIAGGAVVDHPYGDRTVYVFTPKQVKHVGDTLDPIVLPHISTLEADVEFFWEIDELDPMHQSFQYMRRAGVPRDIQRRVVRLPDEEMGRLFRGWFMGIMTPQGVGPPGES